MVTILGDILPSGSDLHNRNASINKNKQKKMKKYYLLLVTLISYGQALFKGVKYRWYNNR
jgi:hypothetical protein